MNKRTRTISVVEIDGHDYADTDYGVVHLNEGCGKCWADGVRAITASVYRPQPAPLYKFYGAGEAEVAPDRMSAREFLGKGKVVINDSGPLYGPLPITQPTPMTGTMLIKDHLGDWRKAIVVSRDNGLAVYLVRWPGQQATFEVAFAQLLGGEARLV